MGHMSKISPETGEVGKAEVRVQGSDICYLPHHGVIKETSTTTKLRVVYDSSATTDNGISLNNRLMVGPKLQEDIFCILVRFREHQVVIAADIEKMYRQILISDDQRDLQRILWRFSSDKPVDHYRLNTVTYGTASASYLAVRCLQQLGLENAERFPEASEIIIRDFYMNDLLTGSNTTEGAKQIKNDVSKILGTGGFILRKWLSNRKEISDSEENRNIDHYISDDSDVSKTLGLFWNSREDSLHFLINIQGSNLVNDKVTKRSILSLVSQIFDPLGLVGPAVLKIKVMLQHLWKLNLSWDEVVPLDVVTAWNKFREQVVGLQRIEIPRQVICNEPTAVQLHCFCDASQVGYGTVIYVRSTDVQGNHHVRLLCSKSRVAPVKVISLPRLELCGALLGAKLTKVVTEASCVKYDSIQYWCDSSMVLSWLAGEPAQWTTFVANRTAEIQRVTDISRWRHVRSESNPADIISRGMDCDQLKDCQFWWQGPDWLGSDENFWPQSMLNESDVVPEQRSVRQSLVTSFNIDLFGRYSSLVKLQRVTAYILRFISNCKTNNRDKNLWALTVDEMKRSMTVLIKLAQATEFGTEIKALQKAEPITKTSKIVALNPFIDDKGVLRVGGRLDKSDLDFEQKHPIILPNKHMLTRLIIKNEHYRLLHAGPQALLAQIRLKYWPIGGRRAVRSVLKNCVVRFRACPRELKHMMGELPRHRVTPSRPFTNVGIDFAGPFELKISRLRGHVSVKSYLCVFVCFATRAVHLEVVGDLTTESFLNCFKRFVARRGICENVYSDNATNFVGANNELKHVYEFLRDQGSQSTLAEYFARSLITWHFIPPRSPHFGGLWESAVKAAKFHIKRVVGDHKLTWEEFNTVIAQIESCLNSRPLTPLTEDPDDLNVITPGHFLIGTSLCALPQESLQEHNPSKLKRYHLMTQMVQGFWAKWSKEYLAQLQQRNKWRNATKQIKVGAMVVLKDDNVPPLQWNLGRVVQLHPGSDNMCRVVSVETTKGVFKRAVGRLCELPIENDSD